MPSCEPVTASEADCEALAIVDADTAGVAPAIVGMPSVKPKFSPETVTGWATEAPAAPVVEEAEAGAVVAVVDVVTNPA